MLGGVWQESRSHSHFIIGYRQYMESTLQLVGDHIKLVKIPVRGRPSGRREIDAPPAFAGQQERPVRTVQRSGFFQIVPESVGFVAGRRFSACPQHPPPGHGAAVVAHNSTNLPRPTRTEELGNVAVGHRRSRRNEVHDGQDRRYILHPHVFSLTAGVSYPVVSVPAGTVKTMSSWNTLSRAAFDLETTGKNSRSARIVTASITVVDDHGELIAEHEWLADPGVEIPAEASEVHGITTEKARAEGRPAAEVTREVAGVLQELFDAGTPVIAFNASYDFTVLAAESARYGVPQLSRFPVLDPYVMNKQVDRYRKGKRTLTALCEEYGVDLTNAHTSAADALATLRVLDAMAGKFPKLQMPASKLHQLQVDWAASQAADFQQYLRRSKPTAVIEGEWPVLPPVDASRGGF